MRVLFSAWAGGGHYAPLVPAGWALRAAGHEVLVACHPSHAPTVTASGLPAAPVGPDIDMFGLFRAKRRGQEWRPWQPGGGRTDPPSFRRGYAGMSDTAAEVAHAVADDLLAFARSWRPDLVIFEPASFAGPLVARVLGIPSARMLWAPDFTAPVSGFPATAGSLAERFGVAELGVLGDLTLDPCPPGLQVTDDLPRQPIRYIPYNGPAVLPGWLREPPARRRIAVTWGTSLTGMGGPGRMAHVPRVVRALAATDAEIIVAVLDSQRELFTDLPPNVRHVGPVPLHLLLPTCDAIIHQGGGGTMMTAMTCGLPQLIIPSIPDQAFNARQLAATGAGHLLPAGEDITETDVARAAQRLLHDTACATAARDLAARALALPAPADIIPVLTRLAAGTTPAPAAS
ncbi:MAG TPA: nucleotide disphospho-sugar-binding domain-containing protein, partial [Streptosporangiaceae bacterium]